MYLSKDKSSGNYFIYFFTANGKRSRKSTKTKLKAEATQFLIQFEREFKDREKRITTPIMLSKFEFEFMRMREQRVKEKTLEGDQTMFNFLTKFLGKDFIVNEITVDVANNFLDDRLRKSSVWQVKKQRISLSVAMSYAVQKKYLTDNPIADIKPPNIPEVAPRYYEDDEFDKLIAQVEDPDESDMINFAVDTGFRLAEICNLEWNQVAFKEDQIRVTLANWNHRTKTDKVRSIKLTERSAAIVKQRKSKPTGPYVFTRKGIPIVPRLYSHNFKKYVTRASLDPKLNFHSLRHTFATRLIEKGASIYNVSKLLGHSNVKTTQIYAHVKSVDLDKTIDLLSK